MNTICIAMKGENIGKIEIIIWALFVGSPRHNLGMSNANLPISLTATT